MSTIGYGSYTPSTTGGKCFTILFGIISIVIFGMVLETMQGACNDAFLGCHRWLKRKTGKTAKSVKVWFWFWFVIAFAFLFAGLSHHATGYGLGNSIYFAFITITTVGFGEFALNGQHDGRMGALVLIFFGMILMSNLLGSIAAIFQPEEKVGGEGEGTCIANKARQRKDNAAAVCAALESMANGTAKGTLYERLNSAHEHYDRPLAIAWKDTMSKKEKQALAHTAASGVINRKVFPVVVIGDGAGAAEDREGKQPQQHHGLPGFYHPVLAPSGGSTRPNSDVHTADQHTAENNIVKYSDV
jgi:hypothetical protein